jgi:DNA-binding LytR/AlgR family response regulator
VFRVLIIEDDPVQAARLQELLHESRFSGELETHVTTHGSVPDIHSLGRIDILLASVDFESTDLTGVDIVQRFFPEQSGTQVIYMGSQSINPEIVYKTPHVWLLMKPIDPQSLEEALEKAIRNARLFMERPIRVRSRGQERVLYPQDIYYIESDRRILHYHLFDEEISAYGRLGVIAQELPARFVQCHKSFLVNLDYVVELGPTDALLSNGDKVPVSQRRRSAMRNAFSKFVRNETTG